MYDAYISKITWLHVQIQFVHNLTQMIIWKQNLICPFNLLKLARD